MKKHLIIINPESSIHKTIKFELCRVPKTMFWWTGFNKIKKEDLVDVDCKMCLKSYHKHNFLHEEFNPYETGGKEK